METAVLIAVAIVFLHILEDLVVLNIARNLFKRFRKARVQAV